MAEEGKVDEGSRTVCNKSKPREDYKQMSARKQKLEEPRDLGFGS